MNSLHLTASDIAKIRMKELEELGIKKSYSSIYKKTLREFQKGIIPSKISTVTEDGRVYRYTTLKMLEYKDRGEVERLRFGNISKR